MTSNAYFLPFVVHVWQRYFCRCSSARKCNLTTSLKHLFCSQGPEGPPGVPGRPGIHGTKVCIENKNKRDILKRIVSNELQKEEKVWLEMLRRTIRLSELKGALFPFLYSFL